MAGTARTRPYHAGAAGATSVAEAEITFSAAAERELVVSLPAGAVILDSWVEVLTAFNAGTSNLITLGFGAIASGTADDLVATVNEAVPGVYPQTIPGAPFAALAAATDVYLYYTPGGTAPTTGRARGFIHYARLAANG